MSCLLFHQHSMVFFCLYLIPFVFLISCISLTLTVSVPVHLHHLPRSVCAHGPTAILLFYLILLFLFYLSFLLCFFLTMFLSYFVCMSVSPSPDVNPIHLSRSPSHALLPLTVLFFFQVNLQLLAVTPAILSLFFVQGLSRTVISVVKNSSRGRFVESTGLVLTCFSLLSNY